MSRRDRKASRRDTGRAKHRGETHAGGARPRTAPAAIAFDATWDRAALIVLAAFALALSYVAFVLHGTPTYGVESDLLGTYIPAARGLRHGALIAEHYTFHGIGYPALLAVFGLPFGGNDWLAARVLNVIAAVSAAALAFRLARGVAGSVVGCLVLVALAAAPEFVLSALEPGTDLPVLVLALAATVLVVWGSSPRRLALAGGLAGLAFVTRYDSAFLPLAAGAILLARRAPWQSWLAYATGWLPPVAGWLAINHHLTGAFFTNENYANIAFEFYGQNLSWEMYWLETRAHFHSFADVVGTDPARFFLHLAINLGSRWWFDARKLMPVWLGVFALPGLLIAVRGRPHARGLAVHFALAYAVLAFAFYVPRFFLYLLPFYLTGAIALLVAAPLPWRTPAVARVRVALALLAGLAGLVPTTRDVRSHLAGAPTETRAAGEWLRQHGLTGGIFARKPHVAYFAGMDYAALPDAITLGDLFRAARASHVEYLFLSPIEHTLRPQFRILADHESRLPGIEKLHEEVLGPSHYYSLFRITGSNEPDSVLDAAALEAARGYARRRPNEAWPHLYLAGYLVNLHLYEEAMRELAIAERFDPRETRVARMQVVAALGLGHADGAARACERALALGSNTAFEHGHLGIARLMQGRAADARAELEIASAAEPANADYADNLGVACLTLGDTAAARTAFDRAVALDPGNEEALYYAARLRLNAGEHADAVRLLTAARKRGPFQSLDLITLADSLSVGR